MRCPVILLTCLAALSASLIAAQEEQPLEDLLRWFPDGLYANVYHFDKSLYIRQCPGDLQDSYLNACRTALPFDTTNLPGGFGDDYTSVTTANLGKLALKACFELQEDGSIVPVNRKVSIGFTINDKPYGSWNWRHRVWVYRFDEMDRLVKEGLNSGELAIGSDSLFGRPVYTYQVDDRVKERFGYATETDEFLVAQKLEHLQAMVVAGMDGSIPMMQQLDMRELADEIEAGTYLWFFSTPLPLYNASLDYVRLKDPASPSIGELEKTIEEIQQCAIYTVQWHRTGMMTRCVYVYDNEETARQFYSQLQDPNSKPSRVMWRYLFINGQERSYRGTNNRYFETRIQNGSTQTMWLEDTLVFETWLDGKKTLTRFVAMLKATAD